MTPFDIVIPTAGRRSLERVLATLEGSHGPRPQRVVVVDDRGGAAEPLQPAAGGWVRDRLVVLRSEGGGPAAARNRGWRSCDAPWVAFLDDDVVVPEAWLDHLAADLAATAADVWGSQGRIVVPLPEGRRPTDWERATAGLVHARWATADMAYRRSALERLGGFDERFPRAYREDADMALRVQRAGGRLVRGRRCIEHPVRPAGALASVRQQAGNADDVRMLALHGRRWRDEAGAPPGRARRHAAIAAFGAAALASALLRRRGPAAIAAAAWAAGTAELATSRIAPGPRGPREVATMVGTSLLLPPVATAHRLRALADVALHGRPEAWRA